MQPAISVRGLRKQYPGGRGVRDVSFDVAPGEIFGVLGRNGAGKSTAVECVAGLRTRDAGEVVVHGIDPARDERALRQVLGVQLQDTALPEKITVAEAMRLYASFYPEPADQQELLDRLGLNVVRDTYFGRLSGGQQQRLSVALALVGRPRVAILDELTTGLDPRARREVWSILEQLRDTGTTFLLVSHFMQEAQRLCDRVVVIDEGQVVALDSPGRLAAAMEAAQRMSFTLVRPVPPGVLEALPAVRSVRMDDGVLHVEGDGEVVTDVILALHENGSRATGLRVEQANLEDAFVALTEHGVPVEEQEVRR